MPHFIIDCSADTITLKSPKALIQCVYDAAEATQLFEEGDIKVRIHPFKHFTVGNTKDDFIHIFANIMEGRTEEEKGDLSRQIVSKLMQLLPEVSIISMNIRDFEKSSYCNKSMV